MTTTGQSELATSVAKLDPYITSSESDLRLEAPQGVLDDIPPEHLDELRTSIAKHNASTRYDSEEGAASRSVGENEVWRGEHGYLKVHWYGWELGMDSYLAGKVLAGTFGAGALATAVGVAATGPQAAVIAASFGLLGPMIMACKHENGWTYIHLIGMPPFTAGGVVCNPFG